MRILKIRGADGKWLEVPAVKGTDGKDGADGATFTPHMSVSGDLSWTNNKGLTNPQTINLMGQNGIWVGKDTPPNGYDVWVDTDAPLNSGDVEEYIREMVDARTGYDGTVYNSVGTAIREQVGPLKDTVDDAFIKLDGNLYDHRTSEVGYVDMNTGNVVYGVQYRCTDFIRCLENTAYISSNYNAMTAFYDKNKVFISGCRTGNPVGTFITPSGAYYFRTLCGYSATAGGDTRYTKTMIFMGGTLPSEFVPYENNTNLNEKYVRMDAYANAAIIKQTSINLSNPDTSVIGYISESGAHISAPTARISDFIPCESNAKYSTTMSNSLTAFYDENHTWISTLRASGTLITTPGDARYMRALVSWENSDPAQVMIVEGDTLPDEFIPYEIIAVIDEDKISMQKYKVDESKFINATNSTWYAFGDSITQGYGSKEGGGNAFTPYGGYIGLASKLLKKKLVNHGAAGSGFTVSGVYKQTAVEIIDEVDIADADLVTIGYGINDYNNSITLGDETSPTGDGTICGNFKYFIEKVNEKAPTAAIVVILPLNETIKGTKESRYALDTKNNSGYTLSDFSKMIAHMCDLYSIPYIDWTHHCACVNLLNITSLLHDGLHPDDRAFEQLAHVLVGSMPYA